MGLTVLPTNIGGVNINSIISPLASLLGGTPSAKTMTFPADLGSNPAMGHAVIFQAYDYKTGLGSSLTGFASSLTGTIQTGISAIESKNYTQLGSSLFNTAASGFTVATNTITASSYKPLTQGTPLATISMFMPETMAINYTANYNEVSMTEALGLPGMMANAYSDTKGGRDLQKGITPYASAAAGKAIGGVFNKLGLGGDTVGALAAQSLGVVTNPQMQLLFKGVDLREFQLEFILTPKTAAEAATVKNICDSFAYYSLPGIAGAQVGNSGQFLTPPQVFSVKFQFLGNSGLLGQAMNAITGALSSVGLGFLTGSNVTSGKPSKTFTVNDCVLTNVSVDYAPNGWATYEDGHPVQTRLLLQFKETTIFTKDNMKGTAVAANYDNNQIAAQFNTTPGSEQTNMLQQQMEGFN